MSQIYINLPVADLAAATAFYEAIGFTKNEQFSDSNGSGMMYDDNLTVMLLTHEFTKWFLPAGRGVADAHTTCQVLTIAEKQ